MARTEHPAPRDRPASPERDRDDRATPRAPSGGEDRAVYIISVAAELAGVHPQTLRIYERMGLLSPARTAGNTRRYSDRDIRRARLIQGLTRGQGLNLAGVQMILAMEDDLERMRRRVERLDRELVSAQERIALEAARLRRESSTGEMVPVSTVRRFLLHIAVPEGDPSPQGTRKRRAAIPLGPVGGSRDQPVAGPAATARDR
jgi:MerR family transcriptional regulator/heat shock protein HspR